MVELAQTLRGAVTRSTRGRGRTMQILIAAMLAGTPAAGAA